MIYIISTQIDQGKGGISSSLAGFLTARFSQETKALTSHKPSGKLSAFFRTFFTLLISAKQEDVVWMHCGLWFSILRKALLAIPAKMKGSKVVFHFHSQAMDRYLSNTWFGQLLRLIFWLSDGVIVVSPWWKQRFLQVAPELNGKVEWVFNPLPVNNLALTKITPQPQEIVRLLSMTRLVEGKGVDKAIQALTKLPEHYCLTVAGDGPEIDNLKALVTDLALTHRVNFLGWVEKDKIPALMSQHHVFVLPSRFDSFGMVYLEAMSNRLPIVALNYQAIPDVVPNNLAGILCINDEPTSIAEAVCQCVELHDNMANYGRNHVAKTFNPAVLVSKLENFLEKLK